MPIVLPLSTIGRSHLGNPGEYDGYGEGKCVETWIGEPLRIVDALERRRFESAAELMAAHLRNGKAYAKQKA